MTTREDEIRGRLEAATPGPWDANERDIVFFARNHGPAHGLTLGAVQGYVSAEEQEANLQFIAHAPEDIAYLLGEVERLKYINGELEEENQDFRQLKVCAGDQP